jgi:hypothetical protein
VAAPTRTVLRFLIPDVDATDALEPPAAESKQLVEALTVSAMLEGVWSGVTDTQ